MYIDGALQFTGTPGGISYDSPTTGTQTSTNVIDLTTARDLGIGDDPALKILVQVGTTFTAGTSLQVALQGAPDDGTGVPGTWTTYASGAVVAEAALLAGRRLLQIDLPRPPSGAAIPRFLRLSYITVGTHTAGTVYGSIVLDRDDRIDYPVAITVPN